MEHEFEGTEELLKNLVFGGKKHLLIDSNIEVNPGDQILFKNRGNDDPDSTFADVGNFIYFKITGLYAGPKIKEGFFTLISIDHII